MPADRPDRDDLFGRRDRAESFGGEAEVYDRYRPGYPVELIDRLGDRGVGEALDVGCGTAKVARLLAGAGWRVLGLDVDERMAAVARSHGIGRDSDSDIVSTTDRRDDSDDRFADQAAPWFDNIATETFPHRRRLTVSHWLAEAGTHSSLAVLDDDVRSALFAELRSALYALNEGTIEVAHRTWLRLFERR